MKATSPFGAVPALRPYKIWKGATARAVHGERITMAVVDVDADMQVPEHSHDNEQLGFVLRGEITMTIAGEARTLAGPFPIVRRAAKLNLEPRRLTALELLPGRGLDDLV